MNIIKDHSTFRSLKYDLSINTRIRMRKMAFNDLLLKKINYDQLHVSEIVNIIINKKVTKLETT